MDTTHRTVTAGPVCLDELVTVVAEYNPRARWNGWLAAPLLDAWSVVRVMTALDDAYAADEWMMEPQGYAWSFDPADGALVTVDRQALAEYGPAVATDRIMPTPDGLYALGASSWVWDEDDTAEWCEVCHGLLDDGDEPGHAQAFGRMVAVCSEACTDALYAAEDGDAS
jgi:hypothetical protein